MDKSEQAYRDFYHKVKASVSLDEWNSIWNFIERQWKGDSPIAMVTTEKKRGDGTWQSDITWTVRDQPPLDTPLYVHPPGVFLDFDQLGIAGPFPVIGEKVSVPAITISDLVRMAAPSTQPVITAYRIRRKGDLPGTDWIDGAPSPGETGKEVWPDGYLELAYAATPQDQVNAARYRNLRQATVTGNQEWLNRLMEALPLAVTVGGRDPTLREFDAAIDAAGECHA